MSPYFWLKIKFLMNNKFLSLFYIFFYVTLDRNDCSGVDGGEIESHLCAVWNNQKPTRIIFFLSTKGENLISGINRALLLNKFKIDLFSNKINEIKLNNNIKILL